MFIQMYMTVVHSNIKKFVLFVYVFNLSDWNIKDNYLSTFITIIILIIIIIVVFSLTFNYVSVISWRSVLCNKICQWFASGRWLNTINQTKTINIILRHLILFCFVFKHLSTVERNTSFMMFNLLFRFLHIKNFILTAW